LSTTYVFDCFFLVAANPFYVCMYLVLTLNCNLDGMLETKWKTHGRQSTVQAALLVRRPALRVCIAKAWYFNISDSSEPAVNVWARTE
jgi:hypothetical protein